MVRSRCKQPATPARSQALIETPLEVDAGQVSVSLTVDGRSFGSTLWHKEQVGSFGRAVHPSPRQLMAQLRGASVAVIEVPELASVPITFDVSGMFDTRCKRTSTSAATTSRARIRSLPLPLNALGVSSMPNADDGVTELIAWLRIPGNPKIVQTDLLSFHRRVDEPNLGLIMTCGPSGVSMSIYGERTSELVGNHLRVQWRTDGGAVHQALWQVAHFSTGSTQVSPELASEVISSWRNASELELTLLDAVPSSHRFNLDALFDNPVADTFDECLTMPIPATVAAGDRNSPDVRYPSHVCSGPLPWFIVDHQLCRVVGQPALCRIERTTLIPAQSCPSSAVSMGCQSASANWTRCSLCLSPETRSKSPGTLTVDRTPRCGMCGPHSTTTTSRHPTTQASTPPQRRRDSHHSRRLGPSHHQDVRTRTTRNSGTLPSNQTSTLAALPGPILGTNEPHWQRIS